MNQLVSIFSATDSVLKWKRKRIGNELVMLVLSEHCLCPSSCPVGSLAWHHQDSARPRFPVLVLDLGNLRETLAALLVLLCLQVPVYLFFSFSNNEKELMTFEGIFSKELRADKSIKSEALRVRPYVKEAV